jgi:hypothetical protein
MINWKGFGRSGCRNIEALSRLLSGGTGENYDKSGELVTRPGFEP